MNLLIYTLLFPSALRVFSPHFFPVWQLVNSTQEGSLFCHLSHSTGVSPVLKLLPSTGVGHTCISMLPFLLSLPCATPFLCMGLKAKRKMPVFFKTYHMSFSANALLLKPHSFPGLGCLKGHLTRTPVFWNPEQLDRSVYKACLLGTP